MRTLKPNESCVGPLPAEASLVPVQGRGSQPRVSGIGLWSVAKVSLVIYAVAGLALVTAAVLLTLVSHALGFTAHLDRIARKLLNIQSLSLSPVVVAEWAALIAAVLTATGVLLHVMAAFVYNRIAELTGGVGMHIDGVGTSRPPDGRAGPAR